MDPEEVTTLDENNDNEVLEDTATPDVDNVLADEVSNDNETFTTGEIINDEDDSVMNSQIVQDNDEGIDEDTTSLSKDDSKPEDDQTYSSSVNDSLTENFGSMTTVDDDTQQERVTPPIERSPEPPSPQGVSPTSPTSDTTKQNKRSSIGSKKRRSNDFKPTVVKPFSFQMEKRIEDRHKYNEKVQKMQKAQEERERLEKERREREEEKFYQEERKKTIPKANPIRHYKPITITPSKKQLTMPEAPKLCLESRNRTPKVADKFESPPRGGNKVKQVL